MTDAQPATISTLEADVAARRAKLAGTVDELIARARPQALIAQQKEALRQKVVGVVMTPEGDLRIERVAAAAGVVAALIALRVWGGRRRRRRHAGD